MDFDKKVYQEEMGKLYPNRKETKGQVCERRNTFIKDYFKHIDESIRIIGNPEKPLIIINNEYRISAFVYNFNLRFMDAYYQGNLLYSCKLNDNVFMSQDVFNNLMKQMELRKMYSLRYGDTDLFLSGYNYLDKMAREYKYPVFSAHDYKLYSTEENARAIVEQFSEYPLVIL